MTSSTTTKRTMMPTLPGALHSAASLSSIFSSSASSSSSLSFSAATATESPSSSSSSSSAAGQPIDSSKLSSSSPRSPSIASSTASPSRNGSVSSRRPSEIRRVPVPRLSKDEEQLLEVHRKNSIASSTDKGRSGSIASLPSQRDVYTIYPDLPSTNSSSKALFSSIPFNTSGGHVRRVSASSGPLSLKSVSESPIGGANQARKPSLITSSYSAQSRKASLVNVTSSATSSRAHSVPYENEHPNNSGEEASSIFSHSSSSTSAFATPEKEIAAYRFPLPPSAGNTPVMPQQNGGFNDESRFEEIDSDEEVQPEMAVSPPRKVSIPTEVMEDCGCGDDHDIVGEDEEDSSESGEDLTAEDEDTLGDMTPNGMTGIGGEDIRLSHYRWQSLDKQSGGLKRATLPLVPHSRSITEETDVALFGQGSPSLEGSRSPSSQLGEAFSPKNSLSPTFGNGNHEKSDSVDSTVDSIFDSYSYGVGGSPTSARTTIPDDGDNSQEELEYQKEQQRLANANKRLSTVQEGHSRATTEDTTGSSAAMASVGSTTTSASTSPSHASFSSKLKKTKKEKKPFNSYSKPSEDELLNAADAMVYTEMGDLVRFGDLWEGQRTIVCFIRHYWCPSCQDYMASIMRVSPEQLRALNLRLIIVGCGNWKMISGYRKLLGGCTYPIVSDPSRAIYRQFGMTRNSMAAGKRSAYVQHGMTVNTLISLKRNLAMPLKDPGELNGLGGEFVLGPGLECSFAHRMRNTRDHAELSDILKALGIMLPLPLLQIGGNTAENSTPFSKAKVEEAEKKKKKMEKEEAKRRETQYSPKSQSRRPSTAGSGRVVIRVMDNPELRDSTTFERA